MATRTVEALRQERDELREQVDRADRENNFRLNNGTISLGDHSRIFSQNQSCRNTISELSVELFRTRLVNLEVSGTQLNAATKKLKEAIDDLDNVRNFLSVAADVITEATKVIIVLTAAVL